MSPNMFIMNHFLQCIFQSNKIYLYAPCFDILKPEMSFREYLHEKAEESRHNETLSYLMFLAGAVFFVGGVLETLSLPGETQWFLFIPYHTEPYAGAVVGLTFIISGISLIVFGIVAGLSYSKDRSWYMQELRKASSVEELMMMEKTAAKKENKNKLAT